jgi:hypothetical protein
MNMIFSASNHIHPKHQKNHSSDKKICLPLANFKKLFTFANEMQQELMNFTPKYRSLFTAVVLAAGKHLPTPSPN